MLMMSSIELSLARYRVLCNGLKHLGLSEISGPKHEQTIIDMFAKVGHSWVKDDETAWCAAYTGATLIDAGLKATNKLNAKSYLDYGVKTEQPQPGDIVVFWRVKPDTVYGHVGIFMDFFNESIWVLSGNQNNKVSIETYPKSRLLGFRTYG
jgi:uncharacterized protein (TIGR02594 family)